MNEIKAPERDKALSGYFKICMVLVIVLVVVLIGLGYGYRVPIWEKLNAAYELLSNREQLKEFIDIFGPWAPVVFITVQIMQVLFAPIPGEATGFIGGYLFGVVKGFVFSSIGLSVGSWINFLIGRFLGKRYVRKLIPDKHLARFDTFVKRQGVIVLFILFIFPGFPKDYLCLFLGLSALPIKVFLVMATLGRMPGTFLLSIQGAFLYERMYGLFVVVLAICIVIAVIGYRYRDPIYSWIEKVNGTKQKSN